MNTTARRTSSVSTSDASNTPSVSIDSDQHAVVLRSRAPPRPRAFSYAAPECEASHTTPALFSPKVCTQLEAPNDIFFEESAAFEWEQFMRVNREAELQERLAALRSWSKDARPEQSAKRRPSGVATVARLSL